MLPGHTLASVHNLPDGTKKAKDRVTMNACANSGGTIKLPLLLIDKANNRVVFIISTRRRCRLSTKIKQILRSTVIFYEIGFLTVLFLNETKPGRTWTRRKGRFAPRQLRCPSKWGRTYISWWQNHCQVSASKCYCTPTTNGSMCARIYQKSLYKVGY